MTEEIQKLIALLQSGAMAEKSLVLVPNNEAFSNLMDDLWRTPRVVGLQVMPSKEEALKHFKALPQWFFRDKELIKAVKKARKVAFQFIDRMEALDGDVSPYDEALALLRMSIREAAGSIDKRLAEIAGKGQRSDCEYTGRPADSFSWLYHSVFEDRKSDHGLLLDRTWTVPPGITVASDSSYPHDSRINGRTSQWLRLERALMCDTLAHSFYRRTHWCASCGQTQSYAGQGAWHNVPREIEDTIIMEFIWFFDVVKVTGPAFVTLVEERDHNRVVLSCHWEVKSLTKDLKKIGKAFLRNEVK